MKKNKVGKKNKLLLLNKYTWGFIFLYFLLGIGATYAYLAFRVENTSVITGNVVAVDVELEVDLVVGTNDDMVPLNDDALSNALNGVGSPNGACVDKVGNLSCQVYKITLINKGSRLKHLDGTVELYAKDGNGNVYNNLVWREITNPTTVKSDAVVNGMSKSTLVSDLTIESKETMVWYIAVWISEIDEDQLNLDKGDFGGTVTFEVNNGSSNQCVKQYRLNEYGFYYDMKYIVRPSADSGEGQYLGEFVFYEDGSVDLYENGVFSLRMPPGTASYDDGSVTLNIDDSTISGSVSSNGLSIDFEGLGSLIAHDLELNEYGFYYGRKYVIKNEYVEFTFVFSEDKSVDFYQDGNYLMTLTGSYEDGIVRVEMDTDDWIVGDVSLSGLKIDFSGLDMSAFLADVDDIGINEYGFYWGRKYIYEEDGEIGGLVFYPDGTVFLYENGELIEWTPDEVIYEKGIIKLDFGIDGIININVLSNGTKIETPGTILSLECSKTISDIGIKFGETYHWSSGYDRLDGVFIYKMKFFENSTVEIKLIGYDRVLYEELVSIILVNNSLSFTSSNLGICGFSVSNDGILLNGECSKTIEANVDNFVFLNSDVVVEGDYSYYWIGDGWSVGINDVSQSSYGTIMSEVKGFPVTSMRDTFRDCYNLVSAPVIPNSVTNMQDTFAGCSSLVNAPVIPNSVTNMQDTFAGCENLEGNIEINANNLQSYFGAFQNTAKPIVITGTISNDLKAQLAATATNGNVTFR